MVGILSLQGDFEPHERIFRFLKTDTLRVRAPDDLYRIDRLVIPGGESTVMLRLILEEGFEAPLRNLYRQKKPIWGTCAGAILIARKVSNPMQYSLDFISIDIERNAYGRQAESMIREIPVGLPGGPMEAVFIRAPRITSAGDQVEVFARFQEIPVLVRQESVLVSTFHPELTEDKRVHTYFLSM